MSGAVGSAAEAAQDAVVDETVLSLRPLSIVADGNEFIVGDPERNVYVLLPGIAVRAIAVLRAGSTVGATRDELLVSGDDVDVADFASSLLELGFARVAAEDVAPEASRPPGRWERTFTRQRVSFLFSRAAWVGYAACLAGAIAVLVVRPALLPAASDVLFLGTPARSIAALTLIVLGIAAIHELWHWLAARAEGVTARFAVRRRLYLLTLETDLSQLWTLPRRRRYGPLLAGMASNAVGLFVLLLLRAAADAEWWSPGNGLDRLLGAVTLVEIMMIVAQAWIFMRTDVYALLVTATGCVNLWRVNELVIRRTLGRLTDAEAGELRDAHPRDLAVVRWYVWVYAGGIAVASWFFVAYFVPTTIEVVSWMGTTVVRARIATAAFWEALVLGAVLLMPKALTAGIVVRDVGRRRRGRTTVTVGADSRSLGRMAR